jgi:adenosylmethionine-8-amino-7-oxononanoate aminotransferase
MLTDGAGRELFDATSSIWTILHGHCHPRIVEAIATQAARLDHATTLGASNPVAESLADRLCEVASMDRAFFAGVSDIDVFKTRFGAVTFEALTYADGRGAAQRDDVAAVIVEPSLQAAAGMRLVPAAAYAPLGDMQPLLIVDEIATGFGRTGSMFAFQRPPSCSTDAQIDAFFDALEAELAA